MWKLTVRAGSKVEQTRFEGLDEALGALATRLEELRAAPRRKTVQAFMREIEPVRQVAARLELANGWRGPRGGVDVRGDGSVEAWSGLLRKQVLEGDPVAALRRALNAP